MATSFAERQIILTITLQSRQGAPAKGVDASANPTFQGTTSNTVRIVGGGAAAQNGLRISAKITRPGFPSLGEAVVQIYNLPKTLIDQLGTLGVPFLYQVGANAITIEAGNAGGQPTKIFAGTINTAYADFSGAPDAVFNITALAGPLALQSATPTAPSGFAGYKSVGEILKNLSAKAGLTLINNFVPANSTPYVSNSYYPGSLLDQIRKVARDSGITLDIDDVKGTLTIAPKNATLSAPGAPVPVIAPPPTGKMVGYPGYTANGIKVRTEFDAAIGYGTTVEVRESTLKAANGSWNIYYLDYDLECQAPDGPWFTNLELAKSDFPIFPQSAAP